MTREGKRAGSAIAAAPSPPPGGGWAAGPALNSSAGCGTLWSCVIEARNLRSNWDNARAGTVQRLDRCGCPGCAERRAVV